MATNSVFDSRVTDATYSLIMENMVQTSAASWVNPGTTLSGIGVLPHNGTELRSESPREKCARYIAEISAAIGGRSERADTEKNSGGKKSRTVDEGYRQWALSRSQPALGLYQQLAVTGMESGRPTKPARLGNITSA